MVRKTLPIKAGELLHEAQGRVLKEAEYLGKLYLYRNFPRVLAVDIGELSIYMEDCGKPLQKHNVPCDWRKQLSSMLHVLSSHDIFHNDWLGLGWPETPNLTERHGILYLIDFTWATVGRDSYPFMNPTADMMEGAANMWHLLELTRR